MSFLKVIALFPLYSSSALILIEIDPVWGTAYNFFGGGERGKKACQAIGALAGIGQVDTTISNFLVPLQVRPSPSPSISP